MPLIPAIAKTRFHENQNNRFLTSTPFKCYLIFFMSKIQLASLFPFFFLFIDLIISKWTWVSCYSFRGRGHLCTVVYSIFVISKKERPKPFIANLKNEYEAPTKTKESIGNECVQQLLRTYQGESQNRGPFLNPML